ncbi:gustatory receptor for sugar taste 64b isoform X2 [Culex quinquefasciatus]|uniref:gustatory receptor for sugar taste 64b isoform X2 n=1 Tax=Culex quinquefasciatus TaxID=7176 RepID=UPI0018E33545|nr:gustatory receptor for sugar taste 64b isoform X2 [Culex quinquefasciatus]
MKLLALTSRHFQLPWPQPRKGSAAVSSSYHGSFHQAIAPVLFIGQCIALMPVVEIFNHNFRRARFKPLSARFLYSMLYLAIAGVYGVCTCRWCFVKGLDVTLFGDSVFIVVVYMTAVLFLLIAPQWHTVLKMFNECEKVMLRDAYRKVTERYTRFNLAWQIRLIAFGIMLLAVIEDSLSFNSAYQGNVVNLQFCNHSNVTFWENFYIREHPQVLRNIPVNFGSVLIIEWLNKCMRLTWTYLDVFIISFSLAAQFRYNQIYYRLISLPSVASLPSTFWRNIRTDYLAVSQLVAFLDDKFGHLILLACANDMFFIATQLFQGFQRRPAFATMIYYWYSLSLLIFRTLCMLYVGSGIHVASMSPLTILRNVPSKNWGLDVGKANLYPKLKGRLRYQLPVAESKDAVLVVLCCFGFYRSLCADQLDGAFYGDYRASRKWRSMMIRWKSQEDVYLRPPYRVYGRSLKFKIRLIGFSVIILAIIEDSLHVASSIKIHHKYINFCNVTGTFWELYYNREHPQVFKYVSYNLPTVLLVEFTHKVYLFIWTFMDLFITLISIGLLTRFEQFYQRIEHLKGKSKPEVFWAEVRGDYTKISSLVTYLDEILSPMILITCASDVFFITFQLYMAVRMKTTSITTIYYRFSLIFLIFRALLMLLTSSHVYVASRKPLEILRAVPMSSWTTSVQRFINEILTIDNALSGHRFFYLKRSVILAMAGTLITYELVMLSEEKPLDSSNICG